LDFSRGLPFPLDICPAALNLKPARSGGSTWFRFATRLRLFGCPPNQCREPVSCILAISFLTAEPPSIKDDFSILGDPFSSQLDEPYLYILRQGRRVNYIKAELYCGSNLVDMLAARPRAAYKFFLYLALVNGYRWRDPNHDKPFRSDCRTCNLRHV